MTISEKGTDGLRSYDDFREREKDDKGNRKTAYEVWQYGNDGLRTVTVVSSFNPNKYKTNKKYYDYTYKKSKINPDTLRLKRIPGKTSAYIYIMKINFLPMRFTMAKKKKKP